MSAPETVAEYASYYGRPVVKAPPWEHHIPIYLFAGGVAAGSSLLGAGAALTGRPALGRVVRLTAMGGLGVSLVALVDDLGRPERFLNMLRTLKLTSPMSVGTWLLSLYAAPASVAAAATVAEMLGWRRGPFALLRAISSPAAVAAGLTAPPVAAYTAVLLADTAVPSWHAAYRELPFVFCGSAAAASGGFAMILAPTAQAGPARRLAMGGAAIEMLAEARMEKTMGLTAEPLHEGKGGRYMKAAKYLTVGGAAVALLGGRSRIAAVAAGAALVAGSFCTRFGVFEAGMASARDPKYTVVPQRERLNRGRGTGTAE